MTPRHSLLYIGIAIIAAVIVMLYGYFQVQQHVSQKVVIGFIGDSITHGPTGEPGAVEAEMTQLGPQYMAVNQGLGGTTTADWRPEKPLLKHALAEFKKRHVSIVSILLGTNDAQDRIATSPEVYRKNMSDIVMATLHTEGIKRVIINNPPFVAAGSMRLWSSNASYLLQEYGIQIATLVNRRSIFQGDTQAYLYFYKHPNELRDGVHPTRLGNVHLGEMWARALRGLLAASTNPLE